MCRNPFPFVQPNGDANELGIHPMETLLFRRCSRPRDEGLLQRIPVGQRAGSLRKSPTTELKSGALIFGSSCGLSAAIHKCA